MKGLLVTLLVLGVLAVGADRVAVTVAEKAIAEQAQSSGGLAERPDVDVRGFPFLTQAVAGRYDDVRFRTTGAVGQAEVEQLDVRLRGVRVPLSDAVRGDVASVPVDGLSGDVLLSYDYLSRQAGDGVVVSAGEGGLLRVRGSVEVLGQELSGGALSEVRLDGDDVVVEAREFETGSDGLDGALEAALAERLDFRFPVEDLPYDLKLTGLRVRPEGLSLTATSGPTVLQR
ncbi:MAG: hypothetical protein JWO60_1352 [Frankiales bacterium]|nr:hypothetical protein [Frankiales bacterium]